MIIEDVKLLSRLKKLEIEYDDLTQQLGFVEVMSDNKFYNHLLARQKEIEEVVLDFKKLKQFESDLKALSELSNENSRNDESELIEYEKIKIGEEVQKLNNKIKILLTKTENKNNSKNITFELSILSGDNEQLNKYAKIILEYSKRSGVTSTEQCQKDKIILKLNSSNFDDLSFFAGRIKCIDENEETEILSLIFLTESLSNEINDEDLEIETLKSSGAGGQHINKTESAVRIKHIPTGLTVLCEDQRSQFQNKEKALNLLKQKLSISNQKKQENDMKIQKKQQQNAIFNSSSTLLIDFKNGELKDLKIKKIYKFKENLMEKIELAISERKLNGKCFKYSG